MELTKTNYNIGQIPHPKYILCQLKLEYGKVDLIALGEFATENKAAMEARELRIKNPNARFVVLTEVIPIIEDSRLG